MRTFLFFFLHFFSNNAYFSKCTWTPDLLMYYFVTYRTVSLIEHFEVLHENGMPNKW